MAGIARRSILICLLIALLAFLQAMPAVSAEYAAQFNENPISESAFNSTLSNAFANSEYVDIAIGIPGASESAIPVRVAEYGFDDMIAKRPGRIWTCIVSSSDCWAGACALLVGKSAFLTETSDSSLTDGHTTSAKVLLYHVPRPQTLQIGGMPVVISARAQAYLGIRQLTKYDAPKRILIIEEPHQALNSQYSLFKGLEILFEENPSLLKQGRTAFLSEGTQAGQTVSLQPLIKAEPKPADSLVHRVLSSYLIPGYMAYEWKHQQGIPIVGIEDPRLYKMSAEFWTDVHYGRDSGRSALWSNTVAARNSSIAQAVVDQMGHYQCPILFVGGLHLEPLDDKDKIQEGKPDQYEGIVDASELAYLKQAGKRSLAGMLREQEIGYCLLTAQDDPMPDPKAQDVEQARYAALFRAELDGSLDSYVKKFLSREEGVTVTPSPEAAAQVVLASSGSGSGSGNGDGDNGDGNKDKKDGGDGNGGGPGWRGKLQDLLDSLGKKLGGWADAIAQKIGHGHAWDKHGQNEGHDSPSAFANFIANILKNPSASKNLSGGRQAFWDDSSGTVVITNPSDPDGGTAFKPSGGKGYFDGLK